MGLFKHLLVATDFSEASEPALELALALALEHGAELSVIHVCELPALAEALPPLDLATILKDAATVRLDRLLQELRTRLPAVRSRLAIGSPWEEIVAASREGGVDLVVIGTHGRRGFAHAMLGSVAERVVRLSPVPVLSVRAPAPR